MNLIENTEEIVDKKDANEIDDKQVDYIVEHPEEFETEILEAAKKRVLYRIIEKVEEDIKEKQEKDGKNIIEVTPEQIESIAEREQIKKSKIEAEVEVITNNIIDKEEQEQTKEENEIGE